MATLLKHFAANTDGRDYVVGDIHGHFELLEALLAYVGFDTTRDRLFSVGDLIDRGPESDRVTAYLAKPWFYAILGNHETMLLNVAPVVMQGHLDSYGEARWRRNGGAWYFDLDRPEQEAIYSAIAPLPAAAEIVLRNGARAGLIHGDLSSSWSQLRETRGATTKPANPHQVEDLVWSRELAHSVAYNVIYDMDYNVAIRGIDVVFFGHTPMRKPVRAENTRWLDTGAGNGNWLSLAELAVEGRVWSMAALDQLVTEGWAITRADFEDK